MQYHSEFNHHRTPIRDRTPWNIAEQSGDGSVLEVFRHFAKLRERLVPYLAAQAAASIDASMPLMRPLALVFPHDVELWHHPYEYLLGDGLLVCPVVEPDANNWLCYLPAGDWIDVWSGERATGPTVAQRDTPLDVIPVWCRADAWTVLRPTFGR
jgi:alpha-glucosidase (family GH31 glycosyl hydrolase)